MTNLTHEQLVEQLVFVIDPRLSPAVVRNALEDGDYSKNSPIGKAVVTARAAIATIAEATKEPTEAMIEAVDDLLPFSRGTETHAMAGGFTPEAFHRAMHAKSPLYPEGK